MQTFRFEFYLVLYSYCYCCCSRCAFASFAIPSSCPLRQSSSDSRVPNANAEPQIHFWFGCQAPASPFKVLTVQSLQLSASGTAFNTNAEEELNVARWLCLRAARLGYQSRIMAVLCWTARQSPWSLTSAQILAYDVKVTAHPPLGRQPPWHAVPWWALPYEVVKLLHACRGMRNED